METNYTPRETSENATRRLNPLEQSQNYSYLAELTAYEALVKTNPKKIEFERVGEFIFYIAYYDLETSSTGHRYDMKAILINSSTSIYSNSNVIDKDKYPYDVNTVKQYAKQYVNKIAERINNTLGE